MDNKQNSLRRQKLVILAIIGAAYSVGVAFLVQNMIGQGFDVTDDFFSRWYASRLLLTTGRSLYDWANSVELSRLGNWPLVHQLGYYYPAYMLIFTAPLSLLPFGAARILWTIFGLWGLWLATALLAPRLSIDRLTQILVLTTVSIPVLQHTLNAQFNTIGILAMALAYRALCRKQYLLAGIWAGGLLFKPQATALVLLAWLIWTAWRPERRRFWLGLAGASLALWAVAEAFEPGWVIHFWQSLDTYEPVRSVIDRIWNPYQLTSLALVALTGWLTLRLRHTPPEAIAFRGLLLWSLSLNALVVPLFGMLHMVLLGPLLVILLGAAADLNSQGTGRSLERWTWWGSVGLLLAGLGAFVLPLLLLGLEGPHISMAELVYKLVIPVALLGAAVALMFGRVLPAWRFEEPRPEYYT